MKYVNVKPVAKHLELLIDADHFPNFKYRALNFAERFSEIDFFYGLLLFETPMNCLDLLINVLFFYSSLFTN
jgi:hypothetical protein